jgi:cytochrome P450
MMLLFAGFDATSSSLTYMLWLLAQHSHMVQKVRSLQHSQYYSKDNNLGLYCSAFMLLV